jgi:hypothetical protein
MTMGGPGTPVAQRIASKVKAGIALVGGLWASGKGFGAEVSNRGAESLYPDTNLEWIVLRA